MPQRFSEEAIEEVTELLRNDRRLYWCFLCARPRGRNYCPASSHSSKPHKVIQRIKIPLDKQIEFYLYQGGEQINNESSNVNGQVSSPEV